MSELIHRAEVLYVQEPTFLRLHWGPGGVAGVLGSLAPSPPVPGLVRGKGVTGVASALIGAELLLVFFAERGRLVLHY